MNTASERKTPEQVVADVLDHFPENDIGFAVVRSDLTHWLVSALHSAGLLVGDPADEQIERAARALFEDPHMSADYTWAELVEDDPTRAEIWRIDARRALTAAGVAPQAHAKDLPTSPGRMKNEADSFNVAPQEPSYREQLAGAVDDLDSIRRRFAPQEPSACRHGFAAAGCGLCNPDDVDNGECRIEPPDLPAPSPDREKLIAEAERAADAWRKAEQAFSETDFLESDALAELHAAGFGAVHCASRLADALAAALVVDEAKLRPAFISDIAYHVLRDAGEGRTVSERLSREVGHAISEALRGG